MKLNLLPTHVSKAGQAKSAVILSLVVMIGMVAAAVWMIVSSKKELADLKQTAAEIKPQADQAVAISKQADEIIKLAGGIILNQKLADAMMQHNSKYPDLYNEVMRYIPSYFRVTSLSAVPAGPEGAAINITGVLQTYQQYADLMLALLRIPDAISVSRQGFQQNDYYVPALTSDDNTGRPIELGQAQIPDDPQRRLEYYQGLGRLDGYLGVGGFGTTAMPRVRGAMPDWSQVTVAVAMRRNIQTPDPRGTLAGAAAANGGVAPANSNTSGGGGGGGNVAPPRKGGGPRNDNEL